MTAAVTALPPPDPIFALVPELNLHWSALDGRLVVSSREVARVFFRGRHQRLVHKIMQDIWDMPMRPDFEDIFRPCADGSIDMTSHGLDVALSHWGFGLRNKRVDQFCNMMAQLVCTRAKEIEAKTGVNPLLEGIKKFLPGVRSLYRTRDGERCCDECRLPERAGPMLHDELWAMIAEPHTLSVLRLHREAARSPSHARRSNKAKGVCGCCVAHALLFNGVRLYEETVGRSDVAKVCEEYAASLHENTVPVPDRSSQH